MVNCKVSPFAVDKYLCPLVIFFPLSHQVTLNLSKKDFFAFSHNRISICQNWVRDSPAKFSLENHHTFKVYLMIMSASYTNGATSGTTYSSIFSDYPFPILLLKRCKNRALQTVIQRRLKILLPKGDISRPLCYYD